MAEITAGFETGANGATLSTGDAGNSTAFAGVGINGSGALVYDNTRAQSESLSCKVTTWGSSSSTGTGFAWTTQGGLNVATDHYGRVYLYLTAYPSASCSIVQFSSVSSRVARLQISATGLLAWVDVPGGSISTASSITLNQWVRVEWRIIHSATVGQMEVKLFNTANSLIPTETATGTSLYNTGTAAGGVHIGSIGNTPDGFVYWIDDVVVNATSYPGPVVTAAAAALSTAHLSAAQDYYYS